MICARMYGSSMWSMRVGDESGSRQAGGIVHVQHVALHRINFVRHVGHGGDDVHVELAEQPLLHYFQVQKAQETASEAAAQGKRALGLVDKRCVVELELLQYAAQFLELIGLDGVHTGEHHRLDLLEACDGLRARAGNVGDGIAHLNFHRALDAGDDVANVAAAHVGAGYELHLERAYLFHLVLHAGGHELDFVPFADAAVCYLEVSYHAAERVEDRVENEGLERF